MDESVEINVVDITNESSNMAAASSVLGAIKRFIGAFVLSDEEKLQAGIDVDNFHGSQDAGQVSEQAEFASWFSVQGDEG